MGAHFGDRIIVLQYFLTFSVTSFSSMDSSGLRILNSVYRRAAFNKFTSTMKLQNIHSDFAVVLGIAYSIPYGR
jgi:hypothetical protein